MDSSSDTSSDSAHLLHPESEKEEDYAFQRPRKPFTTRHRRPLLWAAGGLSLLIGAVLLLATSIPPTKSTFIPSIPTLPVLFTPSPEFSASPSGEHNPWNDLIPLGKGFVRVPSATAQQQNLGPTRQLHNGDGEYCLSVFHQLHCVAMLRDALNGWREGRKTTHDVHGEESDSHQDPLLHVDHCIDYLRQSIMCTADLTLEHYTQLPNGTFGPGVNGYFVTHQCKNWDAIVEFATRHRSRNVGGIH